LLAGADHTKVDIWSMHPPFNAVVGTVSVSKLIVPISNQQREDSITVHVIGWAERKDAEYDDDHSELRVLVDCPKCGADQEDLDGFGVVFCVACGYCQHLSRDNDICGICKKRVTTCQRCGGSGAIRGIEAGFGGVDQGAECGDCYGVGIIVEEVS